MSYQEASPPVANAQQRHRKFTPERIQQIKDLVARGASCEQIASTIGGDRGLAESDVLEAGDQLTTTES